MRPIAAMLPLAFVAACVQGEIGGRTIGSPPERDQGSDPVCAASKNDEIRLRLEPTCGGCHKDGSNKPFFTSLRAFESLLVYEPTYVVSGKPDESRFFQLLTGKATGQYPQMPPPASFASMAENGKTKISVDEIRDWITHLPPEPPENRAPDPSAVTVRRAMAEEMTTALLTELGLDPPTDFASVGPEGALMLASPDALGYVGDGAWTRFEALGGASTLRGRARLTTITPAALQMLTGVSQAWCSIAVNKTGSVLLHDATLGDTSAAASSAIKANIRYLYLRLLGVVATDEDVKGTYEGVFLKYEAQGAPVAWTAVCAAFVRSPEWLLL